MEGLENVPKFLFQHRLKVLVKSHTEIIMPKRFVRGKRKNINMDLRRRQLKVLKRGSSMCRL